MPPSRRIGAALILLAVHALACAANDLPKTTARAESLAPDSTGASWAAACDVALGRLDALLRARDSDPPVPGTDVIEARSLRDQALDLMAAAEYELAFDLLSRAITLLEHAP